jgi:hypothetical protein
MLPASHSSFEHRLQEMSFFHGSVAGLDRVLEEASMASNQRSFTANGHSIRQLKDRASKLKAQCGFKHHEALDEVARNIGYQSWTAVMSEPADPKRDEFFRQTYQLNDQGLPEYREFLATRGRADCPDAFRQYLVEEYVNYQLLGFHRCELSHDPGDPDQLAQQLAIQAGFHGPTALLPHSLSEELLQRLIGHGRLRLVGERKGDSLVPFLFCVIRITHSLLLRDNPHTEELTITLDKLNSATEYYSLWSEMELISRRTRVRFTRPTLETIFQESAQISIHLADSE